MMRHSFASKLYPRAMCCLLFFVAAAASFQGFYTKWHFREAGVPFGAGDAELYGPGNADELRFGLADMLEGTAARPYVYRQMLPALANWLDRVTPQSVKDGLSQVERHEIPPADFKQDSPMAGDPRYAFRYLVVYSVTFLFAWLAVFAMYLVCREVGIPPLASVFAPVLMILALPYCMSGGGYFYDYPELAFLALTVWMGLKFDWWWMLPLVALATWNKESFLFAAASLYPILRKRNRRVGALIGTGGLVLASTAVYLALRLRYEHNPGATVLTKWRNQIKFVLHPMHWVDWEKTYGIAHFKAFSLIPLALIVWTVWRGWRLLPKEIQRYGQLAAAINLPLYFLFCMPGEMRDLSLLYVVFLLLLAVNLSAVTGAWAGSEEPALPAPETP